MKTTSCTSFLQHVQSASFGFEQTSKQNYSKSNQGFTLIELLICITLLAILSAIAAPNFSGTIRAWRVSSITNELVSTIKLAQMKSITTSNTMVVSLRNQNINGIYLSQGGNIEQQSRLPTGYTITETLNPVNTQLQFVNAMGFGLANGSFRYVITPSSGQVTDPATRTVCVLASGFVKDFRGDATCPT